MQPIFYYTTLPNKHRYDGDLLNLLQTWYICIVMLVNILAFGIAKDIFGGSSIKLELPEAATATSLKIALEQKYPRLKQLASYLLAVNNEYADDELLLSVTDEIAIIPPVSGG